MDRIIERAKVVLVPSEWYENGAFVALQALAKGKIVVASDIAGLSEIVQDGETGYLAEPGNPDSFAIAIQKALNLTETEYRNMSARIVAYAKKRCDAENYIEKLCKIYEELHFLWNDIATLQEMGYEVSVAMNENSAAGPNLIEIPKLEEMGIGKEEVKGILHKLADFAKSLFE